MRLAAGLSTWWLCLRQANWAWLHKACVDAVCSACVECQADLPQIAADSPRSPAVQREWLADLRGEACTCQCVLERVCGCTPL